MPEERRSHFHGSGRLKSRISVSCVKSRSMRNEVTFMVVLGDCCTSRVGFLQYRHNIRGSSATNPSYCPEGVLPKVKTAASTNPGMSAPSARTVGAWRYATILGALYFLLQYCRSIWREQRKAARFSKFVTDILICPTE
jgi:hypothetical protein